MSRDYKPRDPSTKKGRTRSDHQSKSKLGLGLWLLSILFIILCVVGLVYIISNLSNKTPEPTNVVTTTLGIEKEISSKKEEPKPELKLGPQFDFYTILPEKEVVVPEYEIKTRTREQLVGKAKNTHYMMQAGSFKTHKEAEQLKIKLAAMGLESNIQKGKSGTQKWYRVNMGPYAQTDSINTIRARLRQSGIDAIITEVFDQ